MKQWHRWVWLVVVVGSPAFLLAWLSPNNVVAENRVPDFVDVTENAGISMTHTLVSGESHRSMGQAWGDYDGDGDLDLYLTAHLGENRLYENNGDGTFSISPYTNQVAVTATLTSGAAVFADYDNDGWADLYLVNFGKNMLYHNNAGMGFTNVTDMAGVGNTGKGFGASWGDYNEDGYLDLYVANYACNDCQIAGLEGWRDKLYHNNGNGTFADVTTLLGPTQTIGVGFIASFVDYDNDGDSDIYLVNDKGYAGPTPPTGPMNRNVLWRNDGAGCGGWCFTDVSIAAGADARVDGMGLAIGDYDHDGDLDLFFTDSTPPTLLQNQTSQGSPTFIDVTAAAGVEFDSISWGAVFFDYDNDTYPDLYMAITSQDDPAYANRLFHNEGDGTFSDPSVGSGVDNAGRTLGASYADYDNDGWLDLAIGNLNEGYFLYRNEGLSGYDWVRFRLQGDGTTVNRDALGSRMYVETSDGETQLQEVKSGSSLGAGNDTALHFGLGTTTVQTATIVWTDGITQTFHQLVDSQEWLVSYPTGNMVTPTLTIGQIYNDLTFAWSDASACAYEWHSSDEAYFGADMGSLVGTMPGSTLTNTASMPANNTFFMAQATCAMGNAAPSNTVGVFHFDVIPGSS